MVCKLKETQSPYQRTHIFVTQHHLWPLGVKTSTGAAAPTPE